MFIDKTYFYGPLMIAEWDKPEVQTNLQQFIDKYEPDLLDSLLGYKLYRDFKAGLQEVVIATKWLNLLYGAEYITRFGNTEKWEGFIAYTDGVIVNTYFPDDIHFIVGGLNINDPAAGQNQYRNSFLNGKTYRVVERGTGPLKNVTEYTIFSGGGFDKAINFTLGGEYTIEFTSQVPLPLPASLVIPANKLSLIANWVYYWYTRDVATQTTGTGEKVAVNKNADNVASISKGVRAYNEMVAKNNSLREFLLSNSADYPQFFLNSGEPIPYFKRDKVVSIYKYINILNL